MADLISTLSYNVDLDNGTKRLKLDRTLICGDNALAVGITLTRGSESVDLTGMTAMLWAVRADGASVFKTAATSGNAATAQLHTQGTAVPGKLAVLFCVTDTEGHTVTPLVLDAYVFSGETDAVVDAGDILPSLSELLAQIDACNTAAASATDAASTANASASAADTAAGNAQDAADAITDITAEAGTLAAGSNASAFAEEDPEDGHINLVFGIPRGDKGERGSLPWYGTAITGNSSEPAAYATGLALVNAGDTYIYTGVDSENAGNEYECTSGGDAATALWIFRRNSRGVPGAGNVSYVDGQSPDGDGNVALNAAKKVSGATLNNFAVLTATGDLADSGHKHSDYATASQGTKADNAVLFNTDQSARTDAEKAQARSNILAASVQELEARLQMDLLWVNAAPTAAFTDTTEQSMDLSDCDGVLITFLTPKSGTYTRTSVFLKMEAGQVFISGGYYRLGLRSVTLATTGVTFGEGLYYTTYSNSGTSSDTYALVPQQIYRIKNIGDETA